MRVTPFVYCAVRPKVEAVGVSNPEVEPRIVAFELYAFQLGKKAQPEGFYRCLEPDCSGGTCPAFAIRAGEIPEDVIGYLHLHTEQHA